LDPDLDPLVRGMDLDPHINVTDTKNWFQLILPSSRIKPDPAAMNTADEQLHPFLSYCAGNNIGKAEAMHLFSEAFDRFPCQNPLVRLLRLLSFTFNICVFSRWF
jgi:hypothetical protein